MPGSGIKAHPVTYIQVVALVQVVVVRTMQVVVVLRPHLVGRRMDATQ